MIHIASYKDYVIYFDNIESDKKIGMKPIHVHVLSNDSESIVYLNSDLSLSIEGFVPEFIKEFIIINYWLVKFLWLKQFNSIYYKDRGVVNVCLYDPTR